MKEEEEEGILKTYENQQSTDFKARFLKRFPIRFLIIIKITLNGFKNALKKYSGHVSKQKYFYKLLFLLAKFLKSNFISF